MQSSKSYCKTFNLKCNCLIQRYSKKCNIIRKVAKVTIKHLIQNEIVRFKGIEINARSADQTRSQALHRIITCCLNFNTFRS